MGINIICPKMVLSLAASGVILRGGGICIRLRQFLAMGVTGPVVLPRSFRQASIGVGNSIAETHALVGLLALLQATNPLQVDVPLLIQLHSDQCLASGHVTIRWDENWIEMKPIRYITDQDLSAARTVDVGMDNIQTYPVEAIDCEIVSIAGSHASADSLSLGNFVARHPNRVQVSFST